MDTHLDWSAYDHYGAGDAFAEVPSSGGGYGKAAAVCIGNRQCQRLDRGVMCPSYRITQDVKHSTWHRAHTLRAALNGEFGTDPFSGPELQEAMDLCVACKACKRECPNGVDMALLRTEFLAQRWEHRGRIPIRERLLAYLPRYVVWLRYVRVVLRLREQIPALARWVERRLGIAAERSLPQVADASFLSHAPAILAGTDPAKEVALFVDTFSNYYSPETAQAALGVLQAAGYTVHVVRSQRGGRPLCCGRTFLSQGLVTEARNEAKRVVETLAPYARRGLAIIGLEPSCLLMLRDEYHALDLGPDLAQIAKSAMLFEEFLAHEHGAKRLRLALVPLPVTHALVHGHCHQKAFGTMKAMRKVLAMIPGLQVDYIEGSCCGMAGSFGLETEHYQSSLRMAELSLLPSLRQVSRRTLLIANGSSCRHQIQDGARRDSVHLAVVLRAALAPHQFDMSCSYLDLGAGQT